jgi:insertion element IS1 protein InsB
MNCPRCQNEKIVKNGSIHNGKPKYKCQACGRQFVENPTKKRISEESRQLIDKCRCEKISLRGIHRITGIALSWIQNYVNIKSRQVIEQPKLLSDKKKGSLSIECDEMWSLVGSKRNKQWLWLALETHSRQIVGQFVGQRDAAGALGLWRSLPPVYRQCAVIYTDAWEAYRKVFPIKRHRVVEKKSGKTNHIERFNNTLRQRISRLGRKTLAFSKKLANHIGAIRYFIFHYNKSLL